MRNKNVEIGQAVVPLKSMDKVSCRACERGEVPFLYVVGYENDEKA